LAHCRPQILSPSDFTSGGATSHALRFVSCIPRTSDHDVLYFIKKDKIGPFYKPT